MANKIEISSYSSLKLDIANELTNDNLECIKFLLREAKIGNKDYKIGKRDLAKVKTGCELMQMLEERNFISSESVENLSIILEKVKRHDLDVKVQDYIGHTISSSPAKHVSDFYGLAGMHISDNYVETSEFGKLHNHLQNYNVAILQGPPGSWKSQHAFNYARLQDHRSIKWKTKCNKAMDIYNSFSHLITHLKLQCVHSSSCVTDSIHNMMEAIIKKLETNKNVKHIIILLGSLSPELSLLNDVMRRFKACSNIKVIVTTVKALPPEWNKYVIHLNGMTKEEAVAFLGSREEDSLDHAMAIAEKIGYLPDGLLFARTYMEMAKISMKSYLKDLERRPVKHLYVDGACEMLLNLIQEKLSKEEKWLFNLLPYINTSNIDIFIVQELLLFYYLEIEKEKENNENIIHKNVDEFLIKLSNYSIIDIKEKDDKRIIKAHAFTFKVLNALKTPEDRRLETVSLLKFFTRHFDVDSRLLEVINRNILLLAHAETMLNTCEEYLQTMSVEVKTMHCYVLCAVGITYRYYGNTELSADIYFQRAKEIVYKYFLDIAHKSFGTKDDPLTTMSEYLLGYCSIQEHAKEIFTKLLSTGAQISEEFIDAFIKNKYRTEKEMNLLCTWAGISLRYYCGHRVLGLMDILRKQNLIMCANSSSETFLVELLIRILYNESKNKWLISLSEEESKTPSHVLRGHLTSSYFPVTPESLVFHQLAHNLTFLLKEHMIKISPDYPSDTDNVNEQSTELQISSFCPIFCPVTIRNGILYMLRSITDSNLPNLLKEALELLEQIDADIQGVGFTEFGVVKRIGDSSIYHALMINRLKMECHEKLSRPEVAASTTKNDYLEQNHRTTLKIADSLGDHVDRADEMKDFRAESEIRLALAKVYFRLFRGNKEGLNKAIEQIKKACSREYEMSSIRLTRFYLKAIVHYGECCLKDPSEEELLYAKKLVSDAIGRYQRDEVGNLLDDVLKDVESALEKARQAHDIDDEKRLHLTKTEMEQWAEREPIQIVNKNENELLKLKKEKEEELKKLLEIENKKKKELNKIQEEIRKLKKQRNSCTENTKL